MPYLFKLCLLLFFSLLLLTPLSVFSGQSGPVRIESQRVSSRLILSRIIVVNKESMDHLARTPHKAPGALTVQENRAVQGLVAVIRSGHVQTVEHQWSALLSSIDHRKVPVDVSELIQYVLRESYLQSNQDLQRTADKVKVINDRKNQIRNDLAKLRQQRQALFPVKAAQPVREPQIVQLEHNIKKLEEMLAGLGDDAQLANVDLQNTLQKQQQLIQMLSNISKLLSDTAMAVIRKIGG